MVLWFRFPLRYLPHITLFSSVLVFDTREAQGFLPSTTTKLLEVNWRNEAISATFTCAGNKGRGKREGSTNWAELIHLFHTLSWCSGAFPWSSQTLASSPDPCPTRYPLRESQKDGPVCLFEHRLVIYLMGLWNICLPLILQQFETHSVFLLLKAASICCSYSTLCVQQYGTPTFHFAAHSVKFPFYGRCGGEGQAIYLWVPNYYLVACYSWNVSESLAISFFTEQA